MRPHSSALYAALGGGWEPATAETLLPAETREQLRARGAWDNLLDAAPADPPAHHE